MTRQAPGGRPPARGRPVPAGRRRDQAAPLRDRQGPTGPRPRGPGAPARPPRRPDSSDALRDLPKGRGRTWVYRGWLLHPEAYTELYEAIAERGDRLFVHPDEFEAASCVPSWAPGLGDRTPATVWTEGDAPREAWDLALEQLGAPPWIVKDHVKSAKEQWSEACFVPAGATPERFAQICRALVDIRGDHGGLVVRRFVNLRPIPYTLAFGQAQGPLLNNVRIRPPLGSRPRRRSSVTCRRACSLLAPCGRGPGSPSVLDTTSGRTRTTNTA